MDSATRVQIAAPPTGLMVFQTDGRAGFWYVLGNTSGSQVQRLLVE